MAKQLFNDIDQFLLGRWSEARSLEEGMESVRTKYKELFQKVIDAVVEAMPQLDYFKVYPTQFWGGGSIGFGKSGWPKADDYWFPGLWLDNLRLEMLVDDESSPNSTIWIPAKLAKKEGWELPKLRTQILAGAQRIFSEDEAKKMDPNDGDPEVMIRLPMTSKNELIEMLKERDSQRFVNCLLSQVQSLNRFTPLLDEIFRR